MSLKTAVQSSLLVAAALMMRQRHAALEPKYKEKMDHVTMNTDFAGKETRVPTQLSVPLFSPRVEFAVKMHCQSCVKQVQDILVNFEGVSQVDVSLEDGTAVVIGNIVAGDVLKALTDAGRDARIVGLGSSSTATLVPKEVGLAEEWGAAVSEFKGKIYGHGDVLGVVRFVQVDHDVCSVETEISGLKAETKHTLHVHEYGDTRSIPKTTGKPIKDSLVSEGVTSRDGMLKTNQLVPLHVWELIGRSVVLYEADVPIQGTVVARSAGVGSNSGKRLCTCDGTVIWEAKY